MADIDSFKYAQVRQKILDAVRQDLIGPIGGENEVLEKDSPTQTYITGILFPADSAITEDENYNDIEFTDAGPDSEGENYGFNTDEDEKPEDSVKKGFQRPSSMGISFYIKSDVKQLNATVRYGKYSQETKKEIIFVPVESEDEEETTSDSEQQMQEKTISKTYFHRKQIEETILIDLKSFSASSNTYTLPSNPNYKIYVLKLEIFCVFVLQL